MRPDLVQAGIDSEFLYPEQAHAQDGLDIALISERDRPQGSRCVEARTNQASGKPRGMKMTPDKFSSEVNDLR